MWKPCGVGVAVCHPGLVLHLQNPQKIQNEAHMLASLFHGCSQEDCFGKNPAGLSDFPPKFSQKAVEAASHLCDGVS